MFHIIYRITNILNNKIYIGKHSCLDINDGYMGSGKYIKRAILKYGIDNFKKDILFVYNDVLEAYKKEKEIVNENFILQDDVYNLIIGGDSFESINSNEELRKEKNKRAALSMNKKIWNDPLFRERHRIRKSKLGKEICERGLFKRCDWTGRTHKEESKIQIGIKNSESQKGIKNSQYGTCWIYHFEFGNKKIKKEEIDIFLKNGWIKGRKIKSNVDNA